MENQLYQFVKKCVGIGKQGFNIVNILLNKVYKVGLVRIPKLYTLANWLMFME